MAYCKECGTEIADGQEICSECGTEVASGDDTSDKSFVERYGGEPLPFASGRGELSHLYGKVLGAIPIFGYFLKLFFGFGFWCYSINLKILRVITLGADLNNRFSADYNYIKESFYSGYSGEEPPAGPSE